MKKFVWIVAAAMPILYGSSLIGKQGPLRPLIILIPHADKISHFTLYGIIAAAVVGLLRERLVGTVGLLGAGLAIGLISLLEEVRQIADPFRSAEIMDLVANMLGIGLAVAVVGFLHPMFRDIESSAAKTETVRSAKSRADRKAL